MININKKIIYLATFLLVALLLINSCVRKLPDKKVIETSYTLNVNLAGDGVGVVVSNFMGIDCGTTCLHDYNTDTQVMLIATPATGSILGSWDGCDSVSGDTCIVTINSAKTVTATFSLISTDQHTLTITKVGSGTIVSDIIGIDCGTDCTESYNTNAQVTLTAISSTGYSFYDWIGCDSITGTTIYDSTCIVTVDADKTVTATFNSINNYSSNNTNSNVSYTLDVVKQGTGSGTITSDLVGIDCGTDCTENYTSGTSVTLTPVVSSDSTFIGWTGDCSGTSTCILTMDSYKSVTATFDLISTSVCTAPSCNTNDNTQYCSNNQWVNCGTSEICSSGVCVTTIAPAAPSNLQTSNIGPNTVTLTWTDNSNNENGFKIERKTSSIIIGYTTGVWGEITTVNTDITSYTDTSIVAGGQYQYRIRAYNDIGNSAYSNTVSLTA